MKKTLYNSALMLLLVLVFSCSKKNTEVNGEEGFSLYWHHEIFGDNRHLLLAFTQKEALRRDYDLHFEYKIDNKEITVRLVGATDRGECPKFPMPFGTADTDLCNSDGIIRIPDAELPAGNYTLKLVTDKMMAVSQLTVTTEKISLDIPSNSLLSSQTQEVFPIPANILFGSIHYTGAHNEKFAKNLINDLSILGLKPAEVTDHPYRYLDVKTKLHLSQESWQNGEHSITLLYAMTKNFRQIIEIVQKHYLLSDRQLKLGLYSSNGDQALLWGGDGDVIVYAK